MKMIRDSRFPLRNRVPGSTIVRIVFGAIFAVVFFLLLASAITASNDDDMTLSLVFGFQFLIGATLMILFGVRSLVLAKKNATIYVPPTPPTWDPTNPYFTVTCPTCQAPFDYQQSDLGFRAWYPNSYIECPCCHKPIRHNVVQYAYIPPAPVNYAPPANYPNTPTNYPNHY